MRTLAILVLLGVCFVVPARTSAATPANWQSVLSRASLQLRHEGRSAVARSLRAHAGVAAVNLGADGRTLIVTFRHGPEAAILPAGRPRPLTLTSGRVQTEAAPGSAGRAVVLEPFATELGLGPHAGDLQAQFLEDAGYSVDQLYDGAVTVDEMEKLDQYNVVDIDTHSGANQYGEGVMATGEPYGDDPSLQPWVKEMSVMPTTVAGTSQLYYGVLSHFFVAHESRFPPNALVFVNGCDLLEATVFWQALAYQGVGAMVSWDGLVEPGDAETSGNLLIANLTSGMSVSDAISAVLRVGAGTSVVNGTTSRLGYLGNGNLTLAEGSEPTPTPTPASTAAPSPTVAPTVPAPHRSPATTWWRPY